MKLPIREMSSRNFQLTEFYPELWSWSNTLFIYQRIETNLQDKNMNLNRIFYFEFFIIWKLTQMSDNLFYYQRRAERWPVLGRPTHRCTSKLLHFTRFLHFMLLAAIGFFNKNLTWSVLVKVLISIRERNIS